MTRVDFYVIDNESPTDRLKLACKVTGKAVGKGLSVVMAVDDMEAAKIVDDLLWRFDETSFLPHLIAPPSIHDCAFHNRALAGGTTEGSRATSESEAGSTEKKVRPSPAIVIDCHAHPYQQADVLVNLCTQRPKYFSQFDRLIECVSQDGSALRITRDNHAFYRSRGYPIQVHKLGQLS